MNTTLMQEPPSRSKQPKPPSVSGTQPHPSFGSEHVSKDQRGLRPASIRQGPLPHRPGRGLLMGLAIELFLMTTLFRGKKT